MYASANNPIDYQVVTKSTLIKTIEPIRTFASRPPAQYQQQATGFASQFNAVDSMVCKFILRQRSSLSSFKLTDWADAYSGALLFVAFLGEMRNPWVRIQSNDKMIYYSNQGAGFLERLVPRPRLHLLRIHPFRSLCLLQFRTIQRFKRRQCKTLLAELKYACRSR